MKFIDCRQGTHEWFAARVGVCTASRFSDACGRTKDLEPNAACLNYVAQVALEIVSEERVDDPYETPEMRRGRELEPEARIAYQARRNVFVSERGICLTDDERFGYSTDGDVDPDGAIEIKCPDSARKMLAIWREGEIGEYWHQIQGGLWITGRAWCDLVVYDPRLRFVGKNLYIRRLKRDDDFIDGELVPRLLEFNGLVDEAVAVFRKKRGE